jgi:hypothetical protein
VAERIRLGGGGAGPRRLSDHSAERIPAAIAAETAEDQDQPMPDRAARVACRVQLTQHVTRDLRGAARKVDEQRDG